MRRGLAVMAKEPVAGTTKTRLCPPLTPEEATDCYTSLLLDTLDLMASVEGADPLIAYWPPRAWGYFRDIAPDGFDFLPQVNSELSLGLKHVVASCLSRGYDEVVVMNSDGPTLPVIRLRDAFASLDDEQVDAVLGPSEDGGYYLIGLKRACPELFDVEMSTSRVLEHTLARADALGLRVVCLPPWYDVDTVEDLRRLAEELLTLPGYVAGNTREFLQRWADDGL